VVFRHAEPGHRERREHADRVERTSAFTLAPTTPISATDNTVSTMIPLEKTSRWPRFIIHRGRNESSATKLVRNGKPLKLVLPPV